MGSKLEALNLDQLHEKQPVRYTDHALLYYDLVQSNRGSEESPESVDSLGLIEQYQKLLTGDTDLSWTFSGTMYVTTPGLDVVAADFC